MTARIYVGTYAKYNAGSIAGAWIDLEKYADREAFLEACGQLHKDESDPELMFQDYEGFPKAFYSESSITDALWDWLELDEDDQKLLAAYQDAIDEKGTIDDARDAFHGMHESAADFAADWYDQTGELDKIPDILRGHIDWEGVARDFGYDGWAFHRTEDGVYVFAPN
jgi:antirestriction protein